MCRLSYAGDAGIKVLSAFLSTNMKTVNLMLSGGQGEWILPNAPRLDG